MLGTSENSGLFGMVNLDVKQCLLPPNNTLDLKLNCGVLKWGELV